MRYSLDTTFVALLLALITPLQADDIREAGQAASQCVPDVVAQVRNSVLNIGKRHAEFRLNTPRAGAGGMLGHHVQGVALLRPAIRGRNVIARMIMTDTMDWMSNVPLNDGRSSNGKEGLTYFEAPATPELDPLHSGNDLVAVYRMRLAEDWQKPHVGGAQGLGDYASVALEEKADPERARVYLLEFPRNKAGRVASVIDLDGNNGEPHGVHRKALSAGIARLTDGRYIVAVPGSTDEIKGIWFYSSDRSTINADTSWQYTGHWEPDCEGGAKGARANECYGGGNNFGLVRQCGGQIFAITLNGSDRQRGAEYQWMQVYRVSGIKEKEIKFDLIHWDRNNVGTLATNQLSFRWGGAVHVTGLGNLALLNTERRTRKRDRSYVDGNIFSTESAALETCKLFNPVAWVDDNFRTRQVAFRRSEPNLGAFNWSKKISSVCIPHNWQITLYKKKNFKGSQLPLDGLSWHSDLNKHSPDPNGNNWDNKAKSVRVIPPGGTPPPPFCTFPLLFKHDHFQGKRVSISESVSNLETTPVGKGASSICVPSRNTVVLFDEPNFGGNRLTLSGPIEIPDLKRDKPNNQNWGDRARSVRVEFR